jgi:tetratricopeptide (TPR) repeat protein
MSLALAAPAQAAPTVWAKARGSAEGAKREALIAEAETLTIKYFVLRRSKPDFDFGNEAVLGDMILARAADLLEQAGAPAARDPFLRYRLAEIYSLRRQYAKEAPLLESIARSDAPAVLRARVLSELAITYAHVGRIEDEIKAYGEALTVQPIPLDRSTLLANRAEAYMLLGDVTAAVNGYRAALALLGNDWLLAGRGVTTLWGLAVALDRSGDLDSGLESVRLARTYDVRDARINGDDWFYLPEYDRHWYEALGYWQVARKADAVLSVRADAYGRTLESLGKYLVEGAKHNDRWVPLAWVRLLQCAREREKFLAGQSVRSGPKAVPVPADPEFTRFMQGLRGKKDEEQRRMLLRWIEQHPFDMPKRDGR